MCSRSRLLDFLKVQQCVELLENWGKKSISTRLKVWPCDLCQTCCFQGQERALKLRRIVVLAATSALKHLLYVGDLFFKYYKSCTLQMSDVRTCMSRCSLHVKDSSIWVFSSVIWHLKGGARHTAVLWLVDRTVISVRQETGQTQYPPCLKISFHKS